MTEQQKHLADITEQQKKVIEEIQELDKQLIQKREVFLKLQGIIEYLTQIGVILPEPQEETQKEKEESED